MKSRLLLSIDFCNKTKLFQNLFNRGSLSLSSCAKMKSWRSCCVQSLDEAALDTSSAVQESGATHLDDKNQPSGTCIFGTTENRKPENNNLIDEMLLLKESGFSFHNQDYVEKIKEFQSYVDMVKRFTRPGCSAEALNVVLNSLSSLVNTLSTMLSSKRHIIQASL